jgi:hypothetical protein
VTLLVDTSLDLQGVNKILNLPVPTNPSDAATKAYADAIAQGIIVKDAVQGVAVANVSLAAPGAIGAATAGQRVLLTAQATASQNGLYTWTSAAAALARTTDFATGAVEQPGTATFDENTKTLWVMNTQANVTVDTTAESWTSLGSAVNYAFTAPLTLNGTTVSLNNGNPLPVVNGGTGAATVAGARTALGAVGKFAQSVGDGAATSYTVTHNLGTTDVQVNVYDMATGNIELAQVNVTSNNAVTVTFGSAPAAAGGAIGSGTGKRVVVVG